MVKQGSNRHGAYVMRLVLLGSRDTIIRKKVMVEGILRKYGGMKK